MPSFMPRQRDPFWDDGVGARRARNQQRIVRIGVAIIALILIAVVVARLPAIDPSFLTGTAGRPILGGALLALLGSTILVALARIRQVDRG